MPLLEAFRINHFERVIPNTNEFLKKKKALQSVIFLKCLWKCLINILLSLWKCLINIFMSLISSINFPMCAPPKSNGFFVLAVYLFPVPLMFSRTFDNRKQHFFHHPFLKKKSFSIVFLSAFHPHSLYTEWLRVVVESASLLSCDVVVLFILEEGSRNPWQNN